MTNYVCDKGHKFTHPSKRISHTQEPIITSSSATSPVEVETYVCPDCGTIHFSEAPEVAAEPLEDMLQVPYEQIKEYLKKGYVELDRKDHVYAKGLIMVKTLDVEGERAGFSRQAEVEDEAKEAKQS